MNSRGRIIIKYVRHSIAEVFDCDSALFVSQVQHPPFCSIEEALHVSRVHDQPQQAYRDDNPESKVLVGDLLESKQVDIVSFGNDIVAQRSYPK